MKVRASLRSAKVRDKNCQIVKRKGKLYVINKSCLLYTSPSPRD